MKSISSLSVYHCPSFMAVPELELQRTSPPGAYTSQNPTRSAGPHEHGAGGPSRPPSLYPYEELESNSWLRVHSGRRSSALSERWGAGSSSMQTTAGHYAETVYFPFSSNPIVRRRLYWKFLPIKSSAAIPQMLHRARTVGINNCRAWPRTSGCCDDGTRPETWSSNNLNVDGERQLEMEVYLWRQRPPRADAPGFLTALYVGHLWQSFTRFHDWLLWAVGRHAALHACKQVKSSEQARSQTGRELPPPPPTSSFCLPPRLLLRLHEVAYPSVDAAGRPRDLR